MDVLVQSSTRNKKTGNLPTVIVGQNYKQITKSCQASGCALLAVGMGGSGRYKELGLKPCYAHKGGVSWGTKGIFKAIAKGSKSLADYTIKEGFRLSARSAKYFRLSSIGDASSLSRETIDELVTEGARYNLKPLGYTASKEATHLQEICLLSCPTMKETDEAIQDGWRAAVQLSKPYKHGDKKTFKTPNGNAGIICPEQTQAIKYKAIDDRNKGGLLLLLAIAANEGFVFTVSYSGNPKPSPRNKITCNTCGLCSVGNTHKTKYKAIGFIPHS